jgi:hypothetical protein
MSCSACELVRMTTGISRSAGRLDLLEHLAPVLARQVEVEQDQVRPHRVGELALAAQEGERLTPSLAT